jgi:HSP20 family protein
LGWDWPGEDFIRVDQYRENGAEVIRAELPGIDPDKDVEITVIDGMLRINAERRVESKTEDKGYLRHELHYGSLTLDRSLARGDQGDRYHRLLQGRHPGDPCPCTRTAP